jgi:outer membrane protein assembly factor BamB
LSVPVVANGRVYSSGGTFDAGTGARLWSWPVCQTGAAIAVTSTTVYVPYTTPAYGLLLMAFDANSGAVRWIIPWSTVGGTPGDPRPAAPVVANGVLFGLESNGAIGGNHVVAYDAGSGSRLWDSPRRSTSSYGDPIVANGLVYVASTDGHLDAFEPAAD